VPPSSEFASIANSKLEYVAELEKQREERAMKDLLKLGVQALVKVSAVVDFSKRTEKNSLSEEGAPLSEYTTTTDITTKEPLPEGAPGAMANMPAGSVTPGGVETTEETEETISNYQPSTTETETVTEPGEVKQYIVSAIIEGDYETKTDEAGNTLKEYVGLKPERVQMYEDFLRAAVGEGQVPTEIAVHDHPFEVAGSAAQAAVEQLESSISRDWWYNNASNFLKVLLVAIGFLLARSFLRRATMVEVEEEEIEPVELPHASAEDMRRKDVAAEIDRLSTEQPEVVAALLRSWMAEDEE
jgi:flagellar biosynthesis/type III secretory pathway M-ring protein FliF/YscJ